MGCGRDLRFQGSGLSCRAGARKRRGSWDVVRALVKITFPSHMAESIYGPYLLPSVSVSKSRVRVCLGHDLYVEF